VDGGSVYVELPATGGYVGVISDNLPYSTFLFTESYPDIRLI